MPSWTEGRSLRSKIPKSRAVCREMKLAIQVERPECIRVRRRTNPRSSKSIPSPEGSSPKETTTEHALVTTASLDDSGRRGEYFLARLKP